MRIVIDRGKSIEFRSIPDPHVMFDPHFYDTHLEYQVYELDGTPATGSYRGEGSRRDGMLLLGDPYTKATLVEYRIDREPTAESKDHFEGFLQGLDDKRKQTKVTKKTQAKSASWWDGYRDAWQQKDEHKRSKNPSRKVSIRDGLLLMPQDLVDYGDPDRPTYQVFVEYQVLDRDLSPMNFDYQGDAELGRYISEKGSMRIGDETYTIVQTPEALEKWRGFHAALGEWISPASTRGQSKPWLLGYQEAQGQMKAHKRKRSKNLSRTRATNPQEIANDFVSRHADDVTWEQRIPGGTTRPPCEFDRDALAAGLEIELEHTTDPGIAMEIAMDHLDRNPSHYDKTPQRRARARNPSALPASSREARISRRVRGA